MGYIRIRFRLRYKNSNDRTEATTNCAFGGTLRHMRRISLTQSVAPTRCALEGNLFTLSPHSRHPYPQRKVATVVQIKLIHNERNY